MLPLRTAAIALAMLFSPAAADEFDVFGRPYSEKNMIAPKSLVCATKDAVDMRPVFLQGVRPLYPIGNMLGKYTGSAIIRYRVGEDGKVAVISKETKGDGEARHWFGNHAAIAVASWTFEPALHEGAPVAVNCAVKFQFDFG